GKAYVMEESYLFVRRGMPHLGTDSRVDVQACVRSMEFERGPYIWEAQLPAHWANHFRGAEVLLVAEGLPALPAVGRLRLLHQGAWLLLEASMRGGGEHYFLQALARVGDVLRTVHDGWEQGDPEGVGRYEVHPRLQAFI